MKKLWNENRILFVLLSILAVCFVAIIVVALVFFYNKNTTSYGDRLKDMKNFSISSEFINSYQDNLKQNESVTETKFKIKGRIIYITISFDEKITLDDAKEIITKSLEEFDEKIISYYDIDFVLKSDNFTIIGAKNAVREEIAWNNNREVIEEEETDEES